MMKIRNPMALAALCAALGCSDAVQPNPVPGGVDLVFASTGTDSVPRLFRSRDGVEAPVMIGAGYAGLNPAPSPDGRRIAYQTIASAVDAQRLMVLEPGSAGPVPFGGVEGLAGELSWSPNGRRVVFLSQRDDPAGDILVADVAGTTLVNVTNLTPRDPGYPYPQPDRTPAWSPDGTRIAFTSYRGGMPRIWVMNPDGTGAYPITEAGAHSDYLPSWSPDGRWIAFQRLDGASARIGIVSSAGGTPRFIEWPARAYRPAWSPDGGRIAFSSAVEGDADIYVVTPDGAQVGRIRHAGADSSPAWIRRAE